MGTAAVFFDVPASFYWTASFGRSEDDAVTIVVDGSKAVTLTADPTDDAPAYLRVSLFETTFPGARGIASRGNALLVIPGGKKMALTTKPASASGASPALINTITFPSGLPGRVVRVYGNVRDATPAAVSAEKAAESAFRTALVATAPSDYAYLRSYLSQYVDYSYCGFSSNFSGLLLPRAFESTPEYVFSWLLEATSLFLYMNPVDNFEGEFVGEALWTNILTAAAGPYEIETVDARDTPILLSGIGDDCDGATMIAGDVHLFAHEHRTELLGILAHTSHPVAPGLRCGLEWAWAHTEATPAIMVCNADPDVSFGATSLSDLPELGLHEALLLKRRGAAGFLLVETTCFSCPSVCPADDSGVASSPQPNLAPTLIPPFRVPFDPVNSMGYNQMKPFDARKYPNILTVQHGATMWVSQEMLSLNAVLCSDLDVHFKAVPIPLTRPHPVSPVPNLGSDDALRRRLKITTAPPGVLVSSATELLHGSRTPQTTLMPGHSAPRLPAPSSSQNRALRVGPFSWILAEFDGPKYLRRTEVSFSGHAHHAVL